jgi:hypothetical protein
MAVTVITHHALRDDTAYEVIEEGHGELGSDRQPWVAGV